MRAIILYTTISLVFSVHLFAQNQANDSIRIEQLKEVVVTAQYAPQSEKNAIYKVKVINASTINKKAANNLRELLQEELNLDLAQNSVFGSSIEMQGISKENIKILIDGVPVIGRLNGIIDLTQINLSNIERVEIIEGPVSVFYGTDAMGGILNLVTKKNQQKTLQGNVSAYYESINATNMYGSLGYKVGKNSIRINGGYYNFGGQSTNGSPRNLNWEERNDYYGDLMVYRNLGKLDLGYNGHFSKNKLISIGEPDRSGKIKDKNYFTRRIDNALSLRGNILKDEYIDLTLSYLDYQRYHNTYNVDPVTFNSEISAVDVKDKNIVKYNYAGLKANLGKNKFSDKLNYVIGTDVNAETTDGERILDQKQGIQTVALFSSLNYKLTDGVEVQPGARYTWNSSYGSLVSPALNSKIRFNDGNVLRLSYARGFRAPSLKELFLDFHISAGPNTFIISGNEDLSVEKSHSFNLQYSLNAQIGTKKSILIEPSFFYNDISGLITLSETVNFARHYINIDKFKSVGGKINFTYVPNESLMLKAGYGTVGRYNKFNEGFDSKEFLYSPEISAAIKYSVNKLNLNFDVYYKFSGERTGFFVDTDTNELVETVRDGFHNLNATVSKYFLNNTINAEMGIKNLFDVKDIQTTNLVGEAHARDLQLWGRSFFIKTTIGFGN
ncbi:MAG TPA: hypothetical protein ENJ95_05240 [Bacteroidetes bacterium]|nr:hypothetical protein [Bacteroidota bacterium]